MHRFARPFCSPSLLSAMAVVAAVAVTFIATANTAAEAAPADTGEATSAAAGRPHANGDHPAVIVARLARRPGGLGIDPNTSLVQPPASVTWTLGPDADPSVRLATGSAADRFASH